MSVDDFGGFIKSGFDVEALFFDVNDNNSQFPPGTSHGLVSAEVTSNGGASWAATTLGCAIIGPCTTFGPYQAGHCAMNPSPQSLLQGPAGAIATSGVTWTTTFWSATVDSCWSPQLVVTSLHDLMLLDPLSQYPLMQSTNSGQTWTSIALPQITATNFGPGSIQLGNSLLIATDGSLFSVVSAASGQRQGLFRLNPGATEWCQVPKVIGGNPSTNIVGSMRTSGADLMWTQTTYPNRENPTLSLHVVPLSSLRC
jgi:hypothetical protein